MPGPNAISNQRPIHTPPTDATNAPPAHAPASGSTEASPPILQLLDGVDRPAGAGDATSCMPTAGHGGVIVDLGRAFQDRGRDGVRDYLATHPRSLAAVGRLGTEALADDLKTELQTRRGFGFLGIANSHDAHATAGLIADTVKNALRERVRSTAIARVDQVLRGVTHTDIGQMTARLARARPGTMEGAVARAIGIDGGEGDTARVAAHLRDAATKIRDFRDHLFGGTWEPSDFPNTTSTAMCAMGMAGATRGSIAHDAVEGTRPTSHALHVGTVYGEYAHLVVEYAHLTFHPSMLTAGPFAVGVAGLLFGVAVADQIEANQEERRAFASEMGL